MDTPQQYPTMLFMPVLRLSSSSIALLLLCCLPVGHTSAQQFTQQPTAATASTGGVSPSSSVEQCELRIVWGGPQATRVSGTISVDRGNITLVRNLCVAPNSGHCLSGQSQAIRISPDFSDTFGGLDLKFQGPADAKLTFELAINGDGTAKRIEFPASELLARRVIEPLADNGWKLAIERQIHDQFQLRSSSSNPGLHSPRSEWTLSCVGNHTPLQSGSYVVEWQVYSVSGKATSPVGSPATREVQIDSSGSWPPFPIQISSPDREGVFAIIAKIRRKRFYSAILNPEVVLSRRLDFVVLDPQADAVDRISWQQVQQLDAVTATQSNVVGWVNKWSKGLLGTQPLPPFAFSRGPSTLTNLYSQTQSLRKYIPLGDSFDLPEHSGELGIREVSNKRMSLIGDSDELELSEASQALTIAPQGWLKIPIPPDLERDNLYRLRIVCPTDLPQELLFSVRSTEPTASSFGNDSGLQLPARDCLPGSTVETDIHFWPNESSFLLIHNPSEHQIASLLRFELSIAKTVSVPQIANAGRSRPTFLKFDKPWLADSLSADRNLDPLSAKPLESWSTWYQAAEHLEFALASTNTNTAIVTVLADGSSLLGLDHLTGGARFDSGTFFSDGRSPKQKDFVELCLRRFDRGNKKIVLRLELENLLPPLVDNIRNGKLQELRDSLGQPWSREHDSLRMDPLSVDFQKSLSKMIMQIGSRYGHHNSFGGIAISLKRNSQLIYPDANWGYTEDAIKKFSTDARVRIAKGSEFTALQAEPFKLAFLNWRAKQLADTLQEHSDVLRRYSKDSKLILDVSAELYSSELDSNTQPQQPQASSSLLGHGLDLDYLANLNGVHILAGQTNWTTNSDQIISAPPPKLPRLATPAIRAEPIARSIQITESDEPRTAKILPIALAGNANVRRPLAELFGDDDPMGVVLSGWQPQSSLGPAIAPQLRTISAFPDIQMTSLPVMPLDTFLDPRKALTFRRSEEAKNLNRGPIRVRVGELYQQQSADEIEQQIGTNTTKKQFVQVVNLAPWQQRVFFRVQTSRDAPEFKSLGANQVSFEQFDGGVWGFRIEAYDIIGLQIDDPSFQLVDVSQQSGGNLEKVRAELLQLENSIAKTADPTQQLPLANLHGGFEVWQTEQRPLGWNCSSLPNVSITPSRELPHSGQLSLRLSNKNAQNVSAWIQSEPIDIPPTGKLVFNAWLRKPAAGRDVQVRLSVVGRTVSGERFERSRTIQERIPNDWGRRPFSIFVRDIPADELESLYLAIDLIGAGEIWVDDASVNLLHLLPDERNYLRGLLLVAKQSLAAGNPFPAEQLLSSPGGMMLKSLSSMRSSLASQSGEFNYGTSQNSLEANQNQPQKQSLLQRLRNPFSNPWKR